LAFVAWASELFRIHALDRGLADAGTDIGFLAAARARGDHADAFQSSPCRSATPIGQRTIPVADALLRALDRRLPVITSRDFNTFVNTDPETAEMVPWTGLEATTRAYAKIIAEVDRLDLGELVREGTTLD
jgi:hypothetical protein